MQIGISIMLAFSVFKLRLSDDVPVQSDIIPLINVYFTLCMSFSLSAMIWFSIKNVLVENKSVPKCLRYVVLKYIWYLMLLNVTNIFEFKSAIVEINDNDINDNKKEGFSLLKKYLKTKLKQTPINLINNNHKQKLNEFDIPVYEIDHRGKKNLLIKIKHKNKPKGKNKFLFDFSIVFRSV